MRGWLRLRASKIMFVFLTPDSVRSQWVSFEAGFAYGQKVEVVPVGLMGIDVGAIGAPLNLLQGFNVHSPDSLSNIVAVTNRVLQFAHQPFSKDEYEEVFSSFQGGSVLGDYGTIVDDIHVSVSESNLTKTVATALTLVGPIAERLGVPCTSSHRLQRMPGLTIAAPSGVHPPHLEIELDPGALAVTMPVVNELLGELNGGGCEGIQFGFVLMPEVTAVVDDHKLSGRLAADGVRLGPGPGEFLWNDLGFSVRRQVLMRGSGFQSGAMQILVRPSSRSMSMERVGQLLSLLFERNVMFVGA